MFPESVPPEFNTGSSAEVAPPSDAAQKFFEVLVQKMGLQSLLDLPLIALSNGQTRRARIIKAILSRPELLLLDEPLSMFVVRLAYLN